MSHYPCSGVGDAAGIGDISIVYSLPSSGPRWCRMGRGDVETRRPDAFVAVHGPMSRAGSPPVQIEFPDDPAVDRILEGLSPSQAQPVTHDAGPLLRDTVET